MNWMTNMLDGIGTTTFTYTPGGQLASESGPWASDKVAYTYTNRLRIGLDLQQPNASDWIQTYGYDMAARMDATASPAGTFTYTYNPGLAGTTAASSLIAKIALTASACRCASPVCRCRPKSDPSHCRISPSFHSACCGAIIRTNSCGPSGKASKNAPQKSQAYQEARPAATD